jgi:hypothetical protein
MVSTEYLTVICEERMRQIIQEYSFQTDFTNLPYTQAVITHCGNVRFQGRRIDIACHCCNSKNVGKKRKAIMIGKTRKFIIPLLMILLCVISFVLGVQYGQNSSFQATLAKLRQNALKQHAAEVKYEIAQANTGDAIFTSHSQILAPQRGEILCLGQYYTIKWQVPQDTGAISLGVAIPDNTDNPKVHTIGNLTAGYGGDGKGMGEFSWKVGYTRDNTQLIPSLMYRITLDATYRGWGTTVVSPYFTIANCTPGH